MVGALRCRRLATLPLLLAAVAALVPVSASAGVSPVADTLQGRVLSEEAGRGAYLLAIPEAESVR